MWDEYLAEFPKVKPYRNKGWPYFNRVLLIIPSKAKGSYTFHGSLASPSITFTSTAPSALSTTFSSSTPTTSGPALSADSGNVSEPEPEVHIFTC